MDNGQRDDTLARYTQKLGDCNRALRDMGQTAREARHSAESLPWWRIVRRYSFVTYQLAFELAHERLATALFSKGEARVLRDRLYAACEKNACECPNRSRQKKGKPHGETH